MGFITLFLKKTHHLGPDLFESHMFFSIRKTNKKHANCPRMRSFFCFHWVFSKVIRLGTPPKFNMESENDGFQEELPFLGPSFQVPC